MRTGGSLKARAIGATLIVPFGAGLLLWPYGTLLVTVLLIVLAAREGARIVGAISGGASAAWSAALLVVPFAAAAAFGPVVAAISGVLTLLALVTAQLIRAFRVEHVGLASEARRLFGTLATATWLSPLLLLPFFGLLGETTPAPWLSWLLAVVWSADTGAYLVGRRFGRRRLAPIISPNKTVEGLIGGLFVATIAGGAAAVIWLDGPAIWALVASAVVALAAEAGDLVESLFKRAAGTDSSSTLIPGHGGVLDRIDSLLLAAPVALIAAIVLEITRAATLLD